MVRGAGDGDRETRRFTGRGLGDRESDSERRGLGTIEDMRGALAIISSSSSEREDDDDDEEEEEELEEVVSDGGTIAGSGEADLLMVTFCVVGESSSDEEEESDEGRETLLRFLLRARLGGIFGQAPNKQ